MHHLPPPERLSAQELAYCASALRVMAQQTGEDARRQESPAIRQILEQAQASYLRLAAKCQRLAHARASAPAARRPGAG